jgi:hypothetical protein
MKEKSSSSTMRRDSSSKQALFAGYATLQKWLLQNLFPAQGCFEGYGVQDD